MAVYLNEDQAGQDAKLIGFPHLLLCMGVVLETGRWLYGYHFGHPNNTQVSADAFSAFLSGHKAVLRHSVRLYGVADWGARYRKGGGKADWRAEMQVIASTLGYHGRVSGFDTGIIDPKDGTYVEFIAEYPQQRCRIYYKRNEKMDYTSASVAPMQTKKFGGYSPAADASGALAPTRGLVRHTTGADIVVTPSNKGQLHQLNYFLRLVNFTV